MSFSRDLIKNLDVFGDAELARMVALKNNAQLEIFDNPLWRLSSVLFSFNERINRMNHVSSRGSGR